MKYKIICFFLLSLPLTIFAQTEERTVRTLEECIDLALKNNLDLKQSHLNEKTSDINFRQNKNALLPTINGNYNLGISNGRSIDPFTNSFVNEQLTFSNAGLGLDATVFNGFRLINSWKQAKLNLKAAEMETEAAKQALILNVTLTYLQVLNAQDLVKLAKARVGTIQGQLDRLRSLYEEETGNPAEYRDLQGQIAADASNLVESENTLETEIINLNTLINANEEITVAALDQKLEIEKYTYTPNEVYTQALDVFPSVKASDLSLEAASKGVAVARSQYTPEISFFANLNTNYSSAARLFTESGTSIIENGDFVTINNQNFAVLTEQSNFKSEEIPYNDQFANNLNSSVGFAVTVPLFNGFRAKNNVALEKIKKEEAQTTLEMTKLNLQQSVKQSYNTMQAAFERYSLLQDQVEAYKESFRINEIRFNNGVSNSVDYIISKNNLDNAQINLANVGYEYLLRVRVLEYYRVGL
ncbi:TolC family protein [Aequorivita lipolytica]|uniref:TolC family protein n=1 Tax=Aequorivita lipolytica TaxID=153267 RepID=A0A5C6YPY4_9FLAO|nr:TolC family protein [Aequorivita lipolytica]TXD68958.1 TolC family protein [Aequorivita lipolytica]